MTDITRLQCQSHIWITPAVVLELVRRYFGGPIPLDPCTEPDNPTEATRFFTAEDDGLHEVWQHPAFVNPPYGEVLKDWLGKIAYESEMRGYATLALIPCGTRFSTKYFQKWLKADRLDAVCFVNHRVPFLRPCDEGLFRHYERGDNGNNADSALYGLNVDWPRFKDCFGELGVCWRIEK